MLLVYSDISEHILPTYYKCKAHAKVKILMKLFEQMWARQLVFGENVNDKTTGKTAKFIHNSFAQWYRLPMIKIMDK